MLEQLKLRWDSSAARTKWFFVIGLTLIVLMFLGMTYWALRDDYQVLFSEMDPQDAGKMVAELERLKTPYRLAENGTTILVDREVVHKTRLKLMGKGLALRGNVGFELFNNTDYGTTEFAQKVNFQRALQGELARTIMSLEEVKHARVHLVLPESGLLRKPGSRAKASISLVVKNDAQLSNEQVTGLQRLVAASVPEMDPAAVTVLDQRGVALTPLGGGDSSASTTSARLEIKKEIESYLTKKVVVLLDRAFGSGRALVTIDVTLNYDQIKVTKEDIVPSGSRETEGGAVLRKRQSQQGAVPRQTDRKEGKIHSTERSSREYANQQSASTVDVEYQNSRRVEQIVAEPGNVRRISVGLLLPGSVNRDRLVEIRNVVEMTVGFNHSRGDAIAVHSVEQLANGNSNAEAVMTAQLENTKKIAPPAMQKPDFELTVKGLLILIAVILVGGFGVFIAYREKIRTGRPPLTAQEREQVLTQIQQWLSANEGNARPAESK